MAMLPALERPSGDARSLLDNFVRETKGELFPTREACESFYNQDENFRRLLAGEIGDNLMYKYRARASFMIWPAIVEVAMDATRRLIEACGANSRIPGFDEFWADFHAYQTAKHASGTTVEEILLATRLTMQYDIGQWVSAGMPFDVSPYRLDEPEVFEFSLTDNGAREMEAALKVWTCSLKGLTKMVTRIQMAWQVRQSIRLSSEAPAEVCYHAATGTQTTLLPEQW